MVLMKNLNNKGQAGVEYLLTFGWILVLVASLATWILFFSGASGDIIFLSSDPDLPVEESLFVPGAINITIRNNTLEPITITSISANGFEKLLVNEQNPSSTNPIAVPAFESFEVEAIPTEGGEGPFSINYCKGEEVLEKTLEITAVPKPA